MRANTFPDLNVQNGKEYSDVYDFRLKVVCAKSTWATDLIHMEVVSDVSEAVSICYKKNVSDKNYFQNAGC
jgi:hypothetical protein